MSNTKVSQSAITKYFSTKTLTTSQKKSTNEQGVVKKSGKPKKRSLKVIDSDSDDEVAVLKTPKRCKCGEINDKKPSGEKIDSKAKSKYFEKKEVNVSDVFGNRPVKRDNSRKVVRKVVAKQTPEFHDDPVFEAELAELDVMEILQQSNAEKNFNEKVENDDKISENRTEKRNNSMELCATEEIPTKMIKLEDKSPSPKKTDVDKKNDLSPCIWKSPRKCSITVANNLLQEISASKIISSKLFNSKYSPTRKSPRKSPIIADLLKKISPMKTSPSKFSPISKSPRKCPNTVDINLLKKISPLKFSPIKSSPSKFSPTRKTPRKSPATVENNLLKKISTSKFFPTKTSPPKSSHTRKSLLFPDLPSNSFPVQKESCANSDFQNKSVHITRKGVNGIDKKYFEAEIILQNNLPSHEKSSSNDDIEMTNVPSTPCNLWVERYKPSTTKQIIGQQGEKSCVKKLSFWLKNWHKNHSGSKKLMKPSPWAKNDDGAYFKATLLSGPPGVGKTTSAHLVAKELGFDVVEFNASDTRSKKLLHQEVSELLSTNSLSPFFTGKQDQVTKNHVLLMDEVDGMAGNEDRGGVQELIQLIKSARVPIICMCNDRNHPKIRSLSNYCFDLRFSKPRTEQIKGAMMSVCYKEKLKINPTDLTEIITSANQDVRLIINHLSMLSIEKSNLANSSKHIKMGPWDITRKIFSEEEHKSMTINDKCDLFFHDYNVTPLFVQENYLNAVPHKPDGKDKVKKMELFARAARSLSLGDLTEKSIRSHNAWGLLPVQAIFSSLVPGDVLEGHLGGQITFPAWFGKNSRQTKLSRLLQELTVHTRLKISGNKEAMNLDYLIPLERNILMPLVTLGTEGIPASLAVLNEYCLVREDLESFTELSSWPHSKNLFAEVDSKVKAAFTRAYNKTSAATPYAPAHIKKASRSDFDSMDIDEEDVGTSQGIEEDEEEEGLEVDSMIMVKKKPASKKVDKDVPSTSKGSKNVKRGKKK